MSKLHEILAVEGNLEGQVKRIMPETIDTFKKKPQHFTGFHKTLEMFSDDASNVEAAEDHQELVTTVHEKLEYTLKSVGKYYNAVLQKEATNQVAKADIVVDGVTIASDVPATFLLGLESKLKHLRGVYESIPTLTPGIKWEKDPSMGEGIYKRVHPEKKYKTEKTIQHKVVYEATENHPAQIERWNEDKNIGMFSKDTWSSMLEPVEKSTFLTRIDSLIRAVKKARQRANNVQIVKSDIAKSLFDYIHSK